MTRATVVKESPSPEPEQRYDWARIADQVRADPGEWYRVFEEDRVSLATAIKQGSIAALRPEKGFVVSTRNNKRIPTEGGEVRKCTLYLKYMPERDKENA